jgi:nucleoside-diphosphate-sugar epimerase
MQNKKILITGGNSNIGSDLVKFFLKENLITSTYNKKKINLSHKNLNQVKYNFKNKFLFNEKFDHLIHCAAITPVKTKDNKKMIFDNLQGLKNILESKSSFGSIVLISTVSVYGEITTNLITEKTKSKKLENYGKSKILMEKYLKKNKKKFNYLILRLPGIIGNFISNDNFLNNIISNTVKNKIVTIYGPQKYFNNVIHTETIAKIIKKFFLTKNPKHEIFNLSSKNPERLIDLVNFIKKQLKSTSNIYMKASSNKSFNISTKKCLKFNIKLINTKSSITKTLNFILSNKIFER